MTSKVQRYINLCHQTGQIYLLEKNPTDPPDPVTKTKLISFMSNAGPETVNLSGCEEFSVGDKVISYALIPITNGSCYTLSFSNFEAIASGGFPLAKGLVMAITPEDQDLCWVIDGDDTITVEAKLPSISPHLVELLLVVTCEPAE